MSKSLNEKILANINRRETEKTKKAEEAEKEKNNTSKASIMNEFAKVLQDCLDNLEDYSSHTIVWYGSYYMPYKFEENAKELGFNFKFVMKVKQSDFDKYIFKVPPFEKGNKRTPAQLKLYKFKQELAKKRHKTKTTLLVECKRIKQEIEAGNFEYSTIYGKEIYVETKESFKTNFEKDVIYKFFSKYGLRFKKDTSKFTLVVSEK